MDGSEGSERSTLEADDSLLIWRRLQLSKAKLKGVTEMAALMAGFSVIATVELTITKGTSEILLVSFTVTTALLVSTTMLSIMIATCVLPHIEAIAKLESISLAKKSPHDDVSFYIDLAWFLANTVSIFLFIVDVVLLCWIKFPTNPAISVTAIMIPVIILLCIFSIVFYRQTVHHQIHMADQKLDELRALSKRLRINSAGEDGDEEGQEDNLRGSHVGINMLNTTNLNSSSNNAQTQSSSGLATPLQQSSVRRNDFSLQSMP